MASRGRPPDQREVVLQGLAEADARVEHDALGGHPGRPGGLQPLAQERAHLADDVVVAGVVLHGPRLAPHVHQAHRRAALGDQGEDLRLGAAGGDVVDHRGPGAQRGLGHPALEVSIESGTAAPPRPHGGQQRLQPAELLARTATGSAPGRVLSAPTSQTAAPSAAIARRRARARTGRRSGPRPRTSPGSRSARPSRRAGAATRAGPAPRERTGSRAAAGGGPAPRPRAPAGPGWPGAGAGGAGPGPCPGPGGSRPGAGPPSRP